MPNRSPKTRLDPDDLPARLATGPAGLEDEPHPVGARILAWSGAGGRAGLMAGRAPGADARPIRRGSAGGSADRSGRRVGSAVTWRYV
jgi:hypothetical protein